MIFNDEESLKEKFSFKKNIEVESLNLDFDKQESISTYDYLKEISILAFPTILFYACVFLQQSIALGFVGRKYEGEEEDIINGIGITNLYINCCVFCISIGLISGTETLCSNAFGVKNYYLLGIYMHRARLISLCFIVTSTVFNYFYAIKILALFPIDERVLYYSSRYIKVSLFYVLIDVFFSANFRFLNIIDKSYVNLCILLISIFLHPLWCWIFINWLDLDTLGCGISILISQTINTLLSSLYIHFVNPCPGAVFWLNRDCFTGWLDYLKFTLPSLFLMCVEWWAFEIQAIIAMNISKLDYAVHVLIVSVNSILYTISIGFGMATTILVGKHITESNLLTTKRVALIIFVFGNFSSLLITSVNLIMGPNMLKIFVKDDEKIINKGTPIIYYLFFLQIFDLSQTIVAGVYRGLGKQLIASIIAFINFYLIQTALSVFLGIICGFGVRGMWVGIGIGCIITLITYILYLKTIDLKTIKKETLKRLEHDKNELINN